MSDCTVKNSEEVKIARNSWESLQKWVITLSYVVQQEKKEGDDFYIETSQGLGTVDSVLYALKKHGCWDELGSVYAAVSEVVIYLCDDAVKGLEKRQVEECRKKGFSI